MEALKSILAQALQMKPVEKCMIIDGLLQSLDEPDSTLDEIWAMEAEKRLKAYKAGEIRTVSYEDVFKDERVHA
jgi:putative addiction module component (TIGR02574 family)